MFTSSSQGRLAEAIHRGDPKPYPPHAAQVHAPPTPLRARTVPASELVGRKSQAPSIITASAAFAGIRHINSLTGPIRRVKARSNAAAKRNLFTEVGELRRTILETGNRILDLTTQVIRNHRRLLEEWRSPADMKEISGMLSRKIGSNIFFNKGGLTFVREAIIAAEFGAARAATSVRLVPHPAERPDFELRTSEGI